MKLSKLSSDEILEMFSNLGVSVGVIDRHMNMIYMNEKAKWFYEFAFGSPIVVGQNVAGCHEPIHVKNIKKLLEEFATTDKPLNFFRIPDEKLNGGYLTVLHFPYVKDGQFLGIMEFNIESSMMDGGRGGYQRFFTEDDKS